MYKINLGHKSIQLLSNFNERHLFVAYYQINCMRGNYSEVHIRGIQRNIRCEKQTASNCDILAPQSILV